MGFEKATPDNLARTIEPGSPDSSSVSIIIVSWNVAGLLRDCLLSIQQTVDNAAIEIIVVDNASRDETVAMLRHEFPQVVVIANQENVGYARANNQGIVRARGDYMLILNPDTQILPGALAAMAAAFVDDPDVGIVGARLTNPDGSVQHVSARKQRTLAYTLFCYALHLDALPKAGDWFVRRYYSDYDYGVSQAVEAVSGAAMLIPAHLLRRLGGFDEGFLHTGEDIELCERYRRAGLKIYYASDARIIHFDGQSSKQAPRRSVVNGTLSGEHYFRRCGGRRDAWLYKAIIMAVQAPFMLSIGLVKLLLRLETSTDFKNRWGTAVVIWKWRIYED